MMHLLLVALGGAIGASLRHLVNIAATRLVGASFPWGTTAINISGCFVMGVFTALFVQRLQASDELRLFFATGILGGFTTFSAFSLDFATLWMRGALLPAFTYLALSVFGSLAAVFGGLWLARSLGG